MKKFRWKTTHGFILDKVLEIHTSLYWQKAMFAQSEKAYQGRWKNLGVAINMLIIFTVVIISQVHTYVNTYHNVTWYICDYSLINYFIVVVVNVLSKWRATVRFGNHQTKPKTSTFTLLWQKATYIFYFQTDLKKKTFDDRF